MRVRETARSLGALSKKWLRRDFTFRRKAVSRLVRHSGFSENMAHRMLDALFSELTETKLWKLLRSEMAAPWALDGFVPDRNAARLVRSRAPRTILHVFPANIPGAAVTGLVMGLLLESRNIAKVSRRDEGLLGLYLESLKKQDERLSKSCVLIKSRAQAAGWAKEAELVIAYGEDESLKAIRRALPAKTPFVGYGHRVSVALVLNDAFKGKNAARTARMTARDVWMADQRGCLSPVLVFAQKGGAVSSKQFARLVAMELERLEKSERSRPRRKMMDVLSAARLRSQLRIRALKGESVGYWMSDAPGLWMVGYDERMDAEYASGSQIIRVKGFDRLSELEPVLQKLSGSLQAASLECGASHQRKLAEWLSVFGVSRICRAGELQHPPLTWHHDGRLNLANWLTWTDLEL